MSLRTAAVLPELILDDIEYLPGDKGLVGTRMQLFPVPNESCVEWIVQDDPDRSVGEQPGALCGGSVGVGELTGVACAKALVV